MISKIKHIRQAFLGINQRNIDFIYPNNARQHYRLADDKVLSKALLQKNGIRTPTTYGLIKSIGQIEAVWKQVQHHEKLVIKPASGRGGSGILILSQREGRWFSGGKEIGLDIIFSHIANTAFGLYSFADEDQVIIEQCIIPHAFFAEIYPAGVPDIRIITLHHKAVMAMLRLPTAQSNGKANLHQGGLGVGIDMENGTLLHAYDGKRYLLEHPDSGSAILGRVLPHWKAIKEMAIATAKAFPLKYLGVDLVIDQELGPEVIEVNVRPGLGIQMANRKGLKDVLNTQNTAA